MGYWEKFIAEKNRFICKERTSDMIFFLTLISYKMGFIKLFIPILPENQNLIFLNLSDSIDSVTDLKTLELETNHNHNIESYSLKLFSYLGDTTQTYSRNSAVSFSFHVLADSGAFVTKAPRQINPPDIIIKPFPWQLWMAIFVAMLSVILTCVLVIKVKRKMFQGQGEIWSKVVDSVLRCILVEDERHFLKVRLNFLLHICLI